MDELLETKNNSTNKNVNNPSRNAHYFKNREENREHAKTWTKKMEQDYPKAIEKSVSNTKYFNDNNLPIQISGKEIPDIIVEKATSTDAIFLHMKDGKICVLNFSSYKNPGGMFIEGSSAQEESLCHESFLYNVLSKNIDFYNRNKTNLNKGLYTNQALLSPNVHFIRQQFNELVSVDVLTCASPNKSLIRYKGFTETDNSKVLDSRVKFVCDILKSGDYDTLILGAYGCGVFAQNPREVAKLFKKHLVGFNKPVKAIFAIPGGNNYDIFFDEMTRKEV